PSPFLFTSFSRRSALVSPPGSLCWKQSICKPAMPSTGPCFSSGSRYSASLLAWAWCRAWSWPFSSVRTGACCRTCRDRSRDRCSRMRHSQPSRLKPASSASSFFGRKRVAPWFYFFSTAMVAFGTTLSAFWIMVNNSWMQVPVGYVVQNGQFAPDDWTKILFNSVVWSRFPHMLLASYLTGAFCVASSGAWYLLRDKSRAEALVMLRMGLVLAAVLMPLQLGFGHLVGDYVHDFQPAKFAAIEGRWHTEQPASEVVIALPDPAHETNKYEIKIPVLGSIIGSMSLTSKEVGLTDFPL